jgi:type II secretory pathway predicted ATPase ExeA
MSPGQVESPSLSSISSVAEPPPFHNNLHYQEVLATLRYGIIARKGLILLIGDAGVGKTTILHQLTRELDSNVTWIFESDPEVNFPDLLRFVLADLEIADDNHNSLSMMQRCKVSLRSQLERGRIVSLIIDNAERLRDESLEYILCNFYSTAPAAASENLLQIVLAGRPELREKLVQPRLLPLKPRSELVCQLKPLRDKDIPAYLKTRLRAAHLAEQTFDSGAIDRIAAYAGGNPHLINAISNRALQVSQQSPVTAEMVARAAQGLNLSEARRPPRDTTKQNLEMPSASDEPFRSVDADATEVVGQTFLNYTSDEQKTSAERRVRKAIRLLLVLLLLAGGAAWLQSEQAKSELSNWFGKTRELVGSQQKLESNPGASAITRQDVPAKPTPGGEFSSPVISSSATASPSPPVAEKSVNVALTELRKGTGKNSSANDPKRARKASPPTSNDPKTAPAPDAGAHRNILEARVYKAIQNRAIIGVDVAVIDGTAFLKGRVATEQQKDAAERAARSVAGVERVDNRIAVGS